MSSATDTLQIAKQLKTLHFTDEQAEGLAEIVRSVEQASQKDLVTRDYLGAQLAKTENKLIVWMISLHVASLGLLIATRIFA